MLGQNGSSRLDTVLKMLLIAFVSLLAFSSGVYFGKEMSDSEYQLKALEKDFNDNEQVADASHDEEATPQEDAMIDEEIAALSNKYMKAEGDAKPEDDGDEVGARDVASIDEHAAPAAKPAPAPHDAKAPAQPAKPEHKAHDKAPAAVKAEPPPPSKNASHSDTAPIRKGVDLTEVKKVAERVANNEAPTVALKQNKADSRKPASLPKVAAANATAEYTVQVASYPDEKAAQTHAAELVQKGFPAYPLEATIKGKTWYRVSVGSFKTQKDAAEYRGQLIKQANVNSAIVQKLDR